MKPHERIDSIININKSIYCIPCIEHPFLITTQQLSPFEVIDLACEFLKLNPSDVISKKRDRNLVDARHMIADLLYNDEFLNLSLKNCGEILGGRDHSTILNSRKIIKNLIFSYPNFREKLFKLHLYVYHTSDYFNH
jgi:chromosomal replication initiation ATPase DnaA